MVQIAFIHNKHILILQYKSRNLIILIEYSLLYSINNNELLLIMEEAILKGGEGW